MYEERTFCDHLKNYGLMDIGFFWSLLEGYCPECIHFPTCQEYAHNNKLFESYDWKCPLCHDPSCNYVDCWGSSRDNHYLGNRQDEPDYDPDCEYYPLIELDFYDDWDFCCEEMRPHWQQDDSNFCSQCYNTKDLCNCQYFAEKDFLFKVFIQKVKREKRIQMKSKKVSRLSKTDKALRRRWNSHKKKQIKKEAHKIIKNSLLDSRSLAKASKVAKSNTKVSRRKGL